MTAVIINAAEFYGRGLDRFTGGESLHVEDLRLARGNHADGDGVASRAVVQRDVAVDRHRDLGHWAFLVADEPPSLSQESTGRIPGV